MSGSVQRMDVTKENLAHISQLLQHASSGAYDSVRPIPALLVSACSLLSTVATLSLTYLYFRSNFIVFSRTSSHYRLTCTMIVSCSHLLEYFLANHRQLYVCDRLPPVPSRTSSFSHSLSSRTLTTSSLAQHTLLITRQIIANRYQTTLFYLNVLLFFKHALTIFRYPLYNS